MVILPWRKGSNHPARCRTVSINEPTLLIGQHRLKMVAAIRVAPEKRHPHPLPWQVSLVYPPKSLYCATHGFWLFGFELLLFGLGLLLEFGVDWSPPEFGVDWPFVAPPVLLPLGEVAPPVPPLGLVPD
jgi:hypothetical protein